jgi:flagellar biosynthesis protein FlhA
MSEYKSELQNRLASRSDLAIGIGVIGILVLMLFPMPPMIIDLLIAVNFLIAFIILLSPIYISRPSDFSVFPGMLLVVTLFRLALNVASTRLILGDGYAGKVINVFGSFMIKGNYVVGIIIFFILFIINFKVIVAGSGRVAEVAARFTLDAMPGKQMAVDADLNNGVIDEKEAKKLREDIRRDGDFYGAMDGASKFVKGDAVAGLIIVFLNIVAGIIIGLVQKKLSISEALYRYTVMTIGDGLVSQIPALLISTSAGIIVTRAGTKADLGEELITQVISEPKVLYVSGAIVTLFGFFPGMPWYFFIPGGLSVVALGYYLAKSINEKQQQDKKEKAAPPPAPSGPPDMRDYLQVDPLELEIGYSLISLVDEHQRGDLLDRITSLRKQIALEVGLLVPPIRIRDNIALAPNQYIIKIRGEQIGGGECLVNHYLALNPGSVEKPIKGIPTHEPAFNLPALWITEDKKDIAEMHGYTIIEPAAMIATHLSEIIKGSADLIITRQDVQSLLDNLKRSNEAAVKELVPSQLSVGSVEQVLKGLLHEGVPIRDMTTILETLADYAPYTREVETLTEYVRYSLARTISRKYVAPDGVVYGITLAPQLEQSISDIVQKTKQKNLALSLPPDAVNQVYQGLQNGLAEMNKSGYTPVVLVSPAIRSYFKKLIEPALPQLPVVSFNEIPTQIPIKSRVTLEYAG